MAARSIRINTDAEINGNEKSARLSVAGKKSADPPSSDIADMISLQVVSAAQSLSATIHRKA
jgi:hypothetical protein